MWLAVKVNSNESQIDANESSNDNPLFHCISLAKYFYLIDFLISFNCASVCKRTLHFHHMLLVHCFVDWLAISESKHIIDEI